MPSKSTSLTDSDRALAAQLVARDLVPLHEIAALLDREVPLGPALVQTGRLARETLDELLRELDGSLPQTISTTPPPGLGVTRARRPSNPGPPSEDHRSRYEMLGELGRGGMGRIVAARDRDIGREVAIKVLLPGADGPDAAERRFWTEVQATGQLEHPSIIPVHDVGRLPTGEPYYVMKRLSGTNLGHVLRGLRRKDPAFERDFTRARLLTVFQQIAYAVAFAHSHGVIHRDIKPGNIMVGEFGEALLIDWGLAKIVDRDDPAVTAEPSRVVVEAGSDTASGTITGTPQYLSPEATEGDPGRIDSRSDVYGLGAVLYEILTLEPPYEDLGFVPTVMSVRQGRVVSPRLRAPRAQIPKDLEELCLRAMAKQPSDRPSAKELADDVGRVLEGARERDRRQREARARVNEGRSAADRHKLLRLELRQAESEAKRLQLRVPVWASASEKRELWALEDRVSELRIEAVSAFEEAEAAFLRALGEVPDDRQARSALASLYFARFLEAEHQRDPEAQRYYRSLVLRYDDGSWVSTLDGRGQLSVQTHHTGLRARLARFEARDRVLRPIEIRDLGRPPFPALELPMGSYVITYGFGDGHELRHPVRIGRSEDVTVDLRHRPRNAIGEEYVLIPSGPAILGGDALAHGSWDRRVVEVDEFLIARYPVTCGEYLAFLDDVAQRSLDEALRHVPRASPHDGHYWGFDDRERRFVLPEVSPGGNRWTTNLPVNGVSARDAAAYVHWVRTRTGEPVRLPLETEWEKAARGVDGRFFPWGDDFDPSFCKMKDSRAAGPPEPEPVGSFELDCSVYGVRDMAGGMREMCLSERGSIPVVRGGCWSDSGLFCRLAFRHPTQVDFVHTGLGFRLVKDVTA